MAELVKEFGPSLGFLATIFAATVAAVVAFFAIRSQRDLARKRAALDFFFKTETDSNVLQLWDKYEGGLMVLDAFGPERIKSESRLAYNDIRNYLNVFELFACSYFGNLFDKRFCENYFRPVVLEAYGKTQELIQVINRESGSEKAYCDFVRLAKTWQ